MPRQRAAGFTLLETLVALAILGLALGFSVSVFTDTLGRSRHAALEASAVDLGRSLLEEFDAAHSVTTEAITGVTDGFHWRLDTRPYHTATAPAAGAAILWSVRLDISWSESGTPKFFHLETLRLLKPTGR